MTAEQNDFDLAEVMRCHNQHSDAGCFWSDRNLGTHCEPYRLAVLALDLQGKVARVEALRAEIAAERARNVAAGMDGLWVGAASLDDDIRAALADSTPAALCSCGDPDCLSADHASRLCPKVSPLETLTDRTCAKPVGHAGACLFAGHDGRTDLEVMPK